MKRGSFIHCFYPPPTTTDGLKKSISVLLKVLLSGTKKNANIRIFGSPNAQFHKSNYSMTVYFKLLGHKKRKMYIWDWAWISKMLK